MVERYERLSYENKYENDAEFGSICLFPKAR